jgi:2-oxoisovalerate dehydrogenase E1 component
LANLLKENNKLTAVFTGDGGTSEGDFHEALNVAAVWNLPVLFCVENNGYGLSTPSSQQFKCKQMIDKAIGYGLESLQIDGNNIVEVYTKMTTLAENVRQKQRPVLVEFMTFRMRGHEEASGNKYVPKTLIEKWAKKDPLKNYQEYLLKTNLITKEDITDFKNDITKEINDNLAIAFEEPAIKPDLKTELKGVYNTFTYKEITPNTVTKNIRLVDAISKGLYQAMEKHQNLILMGQDIADYGGVFKVTEGFLDAFGVDRVRNTPICESSIIEAAYGLSINGYKSVVELQFSDFITSGFNPVINLLAKSYYRWQQPADVVLRMPCGAGVEAGPFHSQTNEAWFTKTPGLKVVYPAFPYDAKGLLATAIEDPNPVLFFEHKALYRSLYQDVPEDYYTLPLGKSSQLKEGEDVSIITYGAGVHWALETLKKTNIQADLIDLRCLQPLDTEAIFTSVKKTGKVIILQEDTLFGGLSSDISALITENCFEYLDAPIKRVASLETPVPFAKDLEGQFLPKERFKIALEELLAY